MLKRILATGILLAGLALTPATQQPAQAEDCIFIWGCLETPIVEICAWALICW